MHHRMKRLILKIVAPLLAIVVLMAGTSFSLQLHFCGDHLMAYSFVQESVSCQMEFPSSTGAACSLLKVKKSCCSDKQIVSDGQDEVKPNYDSFTLDVASALPVLEFGYDIFIPIADTDRPTFREYSPPEPLRDLHKLYEVYLI